MIACEWQVAEVDTEQGSICVASTHLESNANESQRAAQFDILVNAVGDVGPNLTAVIGGG
ncbi:hypothetical protein BVC71_05810 [Marivivens niveibacter]|uniref:Uncharacterized protein n=1 Tax=Marivivens niveibacter TaxID=1930667 RepID=A0A251WY13_9RHOB|nr:hypothetical protein BVC71_05810 [Marivivens niveibacter]